MSLTKKIGIIGGAGTLGSGIINQWLHRGLFASQDIMLSSTTLRTPEQITQNLHDASKHWANTHCTTDNKALIEFADIVLLAVRPSVLSTLNLDLPNHLVLSVLANTSIQDIQHHTNATRIARCIPPLACLYGQAFTPWYAPSDCAQADTHTIQVLIEGFGMAERVSTEAHMNTLTAVTGTSHGMISTVANAYVEYLKQHCNMDNDKAVKIIKQVFHGAGLSIAHDHNSPSGEMKLQCEDVKGVTAAGVTALTEHHLQDVIFKGIAAARHKAEANLTG
jgi:pyrroline-5-carboxylate reductase